MPALEFPRHRVALIHELGARLLDSRKTGTPLESLARDLLGGFHDICMRSGLDRVLSDLAEVHPPLDPAERTGLAESETLFPALVAQLRAIDLDGGGPRNAKPLQLADCIVAALGLTLVDTAVPTTTFDDAVRVKVLAAIAGAIDVELAVPRIREAIIARGRERCEERHLGSYDKLTAQLDERGMKILKQPKIPLDAVQAIAHILYEVRHAVIGDAARTAIDRAKQVIEGVDAEAAARIDLPISLRITPRDGAIARANDERVPRLPAAISQAILESLTDLARLAWRAPERAVLTYAASKTFAVGDLIEHPKFGRGNVLSTELKRMEVEFSDGKHTLVHAPPSKP